MTFSKSDLVHYMRATRLGVVSTIGPDGAPQSALVGIGVTDDHQVVFDTTSTTRKHANLLRDPRLSLVFAGPDERTLQYEGLARQIPLRGPDGASMRRAYYDAWPDGADRLAWPNLVYWAVTPLWARYSDFHKGPLVAEFAWP